MSDLHGMLFLWKNKRVEEKLVTNTAKSILDSFFKQEDFKKCQNHNTHVG
jgi:uncharacterized membrane protein (UPF0127 family)